MKLNERKEKKGEERAETRGDEEGEMLARAPNGRMERMGGALNQCIWKEKARSMYSTTVVVYPSSIRKGTFTIASWSRIRPCSPI